MWTRGTLSQGEPGDSQLPQDAKDLVDQMIMTVGQGQAQQRQTVLDMLRGTSAASSSTAGEVENGGRGLYHECEASAEVAQQRL